MPKAIIKKFLIRIAMRWLREILIANPNMSYAELDKYGIEDIIQTHYGERALILK